MKIEFYSLTMAAFIPLLMIGALAFVRQLIFPKYFATEKLRPTSQMSFFNASIELSFSVCPTARTTFRAEWTEI
jgi:hypothetical protein